MNKDKKMLVFGIYLIIILCMFCCHENWRDEVQAYLLCRDMNFIELLKNVHYEGHPFFYYMIIYPFIKIGFGLKIVNIISLILISISVYLIIYKSKLKDIYKISIIFSFIFIYEYSIIGRSYSLIILLIVIISLLWENKKKYAIPLGIVIGLLLNTHIFLGGFCFLLFVVFYLYQLLLNRKNNTKKENINILIGFIIICLFGIILILQFLPILFHGVSMSINKNYTIMNIIRNMFMVFACFRINRYFIFIFVLLICTIIFLILLYKENKCLLKLLILNMIIFSCISTYIFNIIISQNALIPILFIYFICLINYDKKSNFILFVIFLLFIPNVLISCYEDFNLSFSNAQSAYNYIVKNIPENSILTTMYDAHASTIMGYSKDIKLYDFKGNRYYTYVVWDKKRENENIDFKYIDEELKDRNIYYISIKDDLSNYDKIINKHYNLKEVFKKDEITIFNENYIIYKITSIKEN